MYRVVLVDDEVSVLRELQGAVDWTKYEMEICGAFCSAMEALAFFETDTADIIISDISMPVMDGISMARKLRAERPKIQILFLSAYEDFSYAREALRLGIHNYLLKPIDALELGTALDRLVQALRDDHQTKEYVHSLEQKAEINENLLKEKFFQWLISRNTELSNAVLRTKFDFYHIPYSTQIYRVLILELIPQQDDFFPEDFFYLTLKHHVEMALDDYENYYLFNDAVGTTVRLCILFELLSREYDLNYDMDLVVRKLKDTIRFGMGLECCAGCGSIFAGIANIRKSYLEAAYALKHNTFCGQDTAVVYENIMRDAKDVAFDQQNLRAEILARLRCLDMPAICQRLKKLSLTFRQGNLPFEYIRLAYIDLTISGVLFLRETEYSLADVFGKDFDPIEFMSDQRSLKKCEESLEEYFQRIVDFLCTGKLNPHYNLAKNVIAEIENNISDPELSVRQLAKEFY
ncbi:MAG: response regulator, partial [[Clostridium] leptum]